MNWRYIHRWANAGTFQPRPSCTSSPPSCPPALPRRHTSFIPDPWGGASNCGVRGQLLSPLRGRWCFVFIKEQLNVCVVLKGTGFLSCFLNNAGMEIAMETQREVRLILWYAVPVTNDTPRALFPNIATAGNNIAHFSHVKSHCWGHILRFHAVHSSKCTKKTIQLTCVLLSPTLFF